MSKVDMDQVELLVEIPGVYDGWSWAILKDGTAVNRWDRNMYAHRWWAAERAVGAHNLGRDSTEDE